MSETATPESLDAGTEYVILAHSTTDGVDWVVLSKRQTARTAEAAIRAVGAEGTFVAIPLRSWKSYTVSAKTETKYVVEASS